MYINFWYPIARSEEITQEKPLRVELLSMPFVAFRDTEDAAHVLADTCAHRGGSLSAGVIVLPPIRDRPINIYVNKIQN